MIRKTGVSTGSKGKRDCFLFWKCNRIGQWKKNRNRKRYRKKGEGLNSELPQARETTSGNERIYICDFSRGVLNTLFMRSYPTLAPRPQI